MHVCDITHAIQSVLKHYIIITFTKMLYPFSHPTPLHSLQAVIQGISCFLPLYLFEVHPVLQEHRMICNSSLAAASSTVLISTNLPSLFFQSHSNGLTFFSFPFKHLTINPHCVVLYCCRSWRQRFCFKYFVTFQ